MRSNKVVKILASILLLLLSVDCFAMASKPAKDTQELAEVIVSAWQVDLRAENFQPVAQAASKEELSRAIISNLASGVEIQKALSSSVTETSMGTTFEVVGSVTKERTAKWVTDLPEDFKSSLYYAVKYKATGIRRSTSRYPVVSIIGKDDSSKKVTESLINCAQVINDGKIHVLIGKTQSGFNAEKIQIEVSTKDSGASLTVDSIVFSDQLSQLPQGFEQKVISDGVIKSSSFVCLELSKYFNDTCANALERILSEHKVAVDGLSRFKSEQIMVDSVPFCVQLDGDNLIQAPNDSSVLNEEEVPFLGETVLRKYLLPIAREDKIEIPVNRNVSELFFILISEFPASVKRYALTPVPFFVNDAEQLTVELVYADGQSDFAFPYSLADEGFIVHRSAAVYAIAADENKTLKSVIFHNHLYNVHMNVAAVTVNTSSNRMVAKLADEPVQIRVPQPKEPAFRSAYMQQQGNVIKCGNSFYDMVINCDNGFAIESYSNSYSPQTNISIDPTSGLEVVMNNLKLTGLDFITESINITDNTATIGLRSKISVLPLRLTLEISIDDTAQLKTNAVVTNIGSDSVRATIRFPQLKDLTIGSLEDSWMFFPRYRNVISNENGYHLGTNDQGFPMQFFDMYNPKIGIGIAYLTHNLEHASIDYGLNKNPKGMTAFIQYPGDFYHLEPGQSRKLIETCVIAHAGEWHDAMAIYKEWVSGWYKGRHATNRKWFDELLLERRDFMNNEIARRLLKTPPIINWETNKWQIEDAMEATYQQWGMYPQMMDVADYYMDANGAQECWGDYSYENVPGGLPYLKELIGKFKNDYNAKICTYLLADRVSRPTEAGKLLGERLVGVRKDGSKKVSSKVWYLCVDSDEWHDFFIEMVKTKQIELEADSMYIDIINYWRTHNCYSTEHGHPVPNLHNYSTYKLVTKLRERLPSDIVFWCEYPLSDYNSQFFDGNINYYFLTLHEIWAKSYDVSEKATMYSEPLLTVYRYLFPDIKQIDLIERCGRYTNVNAANGNKFIFFNGEALFDGTWQVHDSVGMERMRRGMNIQKKFINCFTSKNCQPLVQTERANVHANRFPGEGRTLWTLYNGRYSTVRGPVLAIDHTEGATYYDAWNDEQLSPEIVNDKAIIDQVLHPQALGCIVQFQEK